MSKSMTTESVAGNFKANAGRDTELSASGKVASKFKASAGQNDANRLNQHRNGSPRQFDAAEDRGPDISSGAGFSVKKSRP